MYCFFDPSSTFVAFSVQNSSAQPIVKVCKSPANITKYYKLQKQVVEMLNKAESEWWLADCEKMTQVCECENGE